MIEAVISRKLWFPLLMLTSAISAISGVGLSGCSFGEDNVGAINAPAGAPASTPQVPESMKTNDMGEGSQPPPQGL